MIKLLYQADPRNKGTVIALRPETEDPLPCVLTLDQSPLEEPKYEIITHGNKTLLHYRACGKLAFVYKSVYFSLIRFYGFWNTNLF